MREFWNKLDGRRRAGLAVGAVVIVLAVVGAGVMLLKPERDVLFNALAPQRVASGRRDCLPSSRLASRPSARAGDRLLAHPGADFLAIAGIGTQITCTS